LISRREPFFGLVSCRAGVAKQLRRIVTMTPCAFDRFKQLGQFHQHLKCQSRTAFEQIIFDAF